MYDFFVYGYFAVYIAKTFFPTGNAFTSLMLSLGTFAAGSLMRAAWRLDPRLIHRPQGPAHRADPHARADGDRNVYHRAHARLRNHRAARACSSCWRGA